MASRVRPRAAQVCVSSEAMRTQADVQRDADRLLKVGRTISIKIHGKDQHGDTTFVNIEGVSAQQIMDYIHKGLAQPNNFMEKVR